MARFVYTVILLVLICPSLAGQSSRSRGNHEALYRGERYSHARSMLDLDAASSPGLHRENVNVPRVHTPSSAVRPMHAMSGPVDTAWVRRYASDPMPGMDWAVDMAIDYAGNVCVTGYSASLESGMNYHTIQYSPSGTVVWSASYDNNSFNDVPAAICVDASGNVSVTGRSGPDCATVKYDHSGTVQWVARYTGSEEATFSPADICTDQRGNVYITAVTANTLSPTVTTIKYDSSGREEWVAEYDGNEVVGVAVDILGNVYIAASTKTPYTPSDYVTIRYDSAGTLRWATRFDGPGKNQDEPSGLALDPWGNVYVTGQSYTSLADGSYYATVKYDPAGAEQWVAIYDSPEDTPGVDWSYPSALAVDSSGNTYVTGSGHGIGSRSDFATVMYNASGIEQWVAVYNEPGNGQDAATALTVGASGNVYVTGSSEGDFLTVKYTAAGEERWTSRYNGPDDVQDSPRAIAIDGERNVYVAGVRDFHFPGVYSDYATVKYDSSGAEQWVASYDGPGVSENNASDIDIDASDNVYVTGYCPSGFSSDWVSLSDFITIKYDAAGNREWVERCEEGNVAVDLAVGRSGSVYVTGSADSGGYATVKYDGSGRRAWLAHFVGGAASMSLAVDGNENVFVAGSIEISYDNSDYVVIKYDSSGVERWVATYDGSGHQFDESRAIAVDDSGNVYVTGQSYGWRTARDIATVKYNPDGVFQWVTRYNGLPNSAVSDAGVDVAVDASGSVYVTGRTRTLFRGEDIVTIKYNAAGIIQWASLYNGDEDNRDEPTALVLDDEGNAYVTGLTNGNTDYATIKYDPSGKELWVAHLRESGRIYYRPHFLSVDASGNVYVTGVNTAYGEIDDDIVTVKYDAAGVERWIARYDGPSSSYDVVCGIAVNDAGQVHIAGTSGTHSSQMITTIKYVESGTSPVIHEPGPVTIEFALHQNYPNPFNPSTTIEFALPHAGFVTLKVYNVLGEEVAALIADDHAAGNFKATWDASGIPSGVYFYRLSAGEYVQTKKAVFMK